MDDMARWLELADMLQQRTHDEEPSLVPLDVRRAIGFLQDEVDDCLHKFAIKHEPGLELCEECEEVILVRVCQEHFNGVVIQSGHLIEADRSRRGVVDQLAHPAKEGRLAQDVQVFLRDLGASGAEDKPIVEGAGVGDRPASQGSHPKAAHGGRQVTVHGLLRDVGQAPSGGQPCCEVHGLDVANSGRVGCQRVKF